MAQDRYLTHRHVQGILDGKQSELDTGEIKPHAFDVASLQGGIQTITTTQSLTTPKTGHKDVSPIPSAVLQSNVVASRYSIPADAVNFVYPPPGAGVESQTLPHIVFKDPYLPWYRSASGSNDQGDMRIPWIALLSFTEDELLLDSKEKQAIFQDVDRMQQSETLSVKMKVGDLKNLNECARVVPIPEKPEDTIDAEPTEVIFVKKDLFSKLFLDSGKLNISYFRYLSHVRKVALDGMVSAAENQDGIGTYGITISHRTGPIGVEKPVPTFVHLVAIDSVGCMPENEQGRIAMISLYSWSYDCVPAGAFNAYEALEYLGDPKNIAMLQSSDNSSPGSKVPSNDSVEGAIAKRRADGYIIVRHRTVTGEVTAAMIRGPLTPTLVQTPLRPGFTMSSNFGTDLQILDSELSLMDITYESAWQLGKTLAMGDQAFSSALARLRNAIHSAAHRKSKKEVHTALGAYSSRGDVGESMSELIKDLDALNDGLHERKENANSKNRWKRAEVDWNVDTTSHIAPTISSHGQGATAFFASGTDGGRYNEHNLSVNSDFALIRDWVMDKLYFHDVPAQYLIPDPSFLSEESLRFFYVDLNWTDAMIDGALSLANHWGQTPSGDDGRITIKNELNSHILAIDSDLSCRPQIPQYGFLMRSQLLVQFPDLTVTAKSGPKPSPNETEPILKDNPTALILIQRKLAPDTMLCLFGCAPPELESLSFALPAHQQFFTVGSSLDSAKLTVTYKNIYVDGKDIKKEDHHAGLGSESFRNDENKMFDWETRTMKVEEYVTHVRDYLNDSPSMDERYTDKTSISALLGLQLNEPIYVLDVKAPISAQALEPGKDRIFQFSNPEPSFTNTTLPSFAEPLRNEVE